MWSRHWKTADPRAERELNWCPEKLFFKRENRRKTNHIVQDLGSREGEAKLECVLGGTWAESTRLKSDGCIADGCHTQFSIFK